MIWRKRSIRSRPRCGRNRCGREKIGQHFPLRKLVWTYSESRRVVRDAVQPLLGDGRVLDAAVVLACNICNLCNFSMVSMALSIFVRFCFGKNAIHGRKSVLEKCKLGNILSAILDGNPSWIRLEKGILAGIDKNLTGRSADNSAIARLKKISGKERFNCGRQPMTALRHRQT